MKLDRYVRLKVYPGILILSIIKGKKIVLERRYDLIDIKEHQKRHLTALMKFYGDYELLTTWEDLQFIRSIGIRI